MAIDADLQDALERGPLHVFGRMVEASNLTLLCQVGSDDTLRAIYKPLQGERPLWDFPDGALARREVAMAVLSEIVAPNLVPPTVWREDAPLGPGMCQLFIEGADPSHMVDIVPGHSPPEGWLSVLEGQDSAGNDVSLIHRDDSRLRSVALLDAIANNADRKGGHLLTAPDGHLYAIDHGVTFHSEPKLRTVLWGWVGENLTAEEQQTLAEILECWDDTVAPALAEHLAIRDVAAARQRTRDLLEQRTMPEPDPTWPALPWPLI